MDFNKPVFVKHDFFYPQLIYTKDVARILLQKQLFISQIENGSRTYVYGNCEKGVIFEIVIPPHDTMIFIRFTKT